MAKSNDYNWRGLNSQYAYRDENLKALGYRSYRAYLKSDAWADIRARVMDRAKGRCERCRKRPAAQVHHRAYDPATLKGESIDALTAACAGCHKKAELHQKATTGDLGQARYQRLMRANHAILSQARKSAKRKARDVARGRLVK
jgi:hypothetical protein